MPGTLAITAAIAVVLGLDAGRRRFQLRGATLLAVLDLVAPAIAAGLALSRLFVREGPEWPFFSAGLVVSAYVWQRGSRALQRPLAEGVIAAEMLIAAGAAFTLREVTRGADDWPHLLVPVLVAAFGVTLVVAVR